MDYQSWSKLYKEHSKDTSDSLEDETEVRTQEPDEHLSRCHTGVTTGHIDLLSIDD